jgi:hypothetical protein
LHDLHVVELAGIGPAPFAVLVEHADVEA